MNQFRARGNDLEDAQCLQDRFGGQRLDAELARDGNKDSCMTWVEITPSPDSASRAMSSRLGLCLSPDPASCA